MPSHQLYIRGPQPRTAVELEELSTVLVLYMGRYVGSEIELKIESLHRSEARRVSTPMSEYLTANVKNKYYVGCYHLQRSQYTHKVHVDQIRWDGKHGTRAYDVGETSRDYCRSNFGDQ